MADPTSTPPERQARILIVDDHPHTGATLARILEGVQPGIEILTAFNGREALALVGDGVDVLIVDYLMPDMTGLELIERLRALPILRPARIILITAHHSAELVELSRQVQVDDYLIKPVYPKQIRGLVEDTLHSLYPSPSPVRSCI
ncbi:partial Cyclic di-GMP phosphodiesterase response regulator RpfG [uncultured bacterium]|nr:partial Cyclic di-GMP phosphodiesterase response regulator RpfG [uncultured bacterium]